LPSIGGPARFHQQPLLGHQHEHLAFGGPLMLGAGSPISSAAAGCVQPPSSSSSHFAALQGVGAAMLIPVARSIVVTLFQKGPERSKALGIWAARAGAGTVVELIFGGVLTSTLVRSGCCSSASPSPLGRGTGSAPDHRVAR
jgi:MFS family permease